MPPKAQRLAQALDALQYRTQELSVALEGNLQLQKRLQRLKSPLLESP